MSSTDDNITQLGAPSAATTRSAVLDSAHVGDIEGAFGRISIGATELGAIAERDSTTVEKLLDLADQNLYKSKKAGRNRVTTADTDLAPTLRLAAKSNSPTQLNLTLLCR